jgi:hypothetical protein
MNMSAFNPQELTKLEKYFQSKFKIQGISLKTREKAKDSVEVTLNGEFIGTIYKDEEDGETSYDFNMAILEMDLEEAA